MIKLLKKPKVFYGWWIVVAGFLTLFISVGMVGYGQGIFFNAMFTDLGWSRGNLALAMSVGVIFSAVALPFIGAWIDKFGASRLIAIGAFLTGAFLMLASQVHALWQAFIIFIPFSTIIIAIRDVPVVATVSNWFVDKRGRAIGITMAGMGLGGFIMAPTAAYLISTLGWRISWVVLGLVVWVVVIPPALLLMKQKPELMGLLPDGKTSENSKSLSEKKEAKEDSPNGDKWSIKNVLGMRVFWLIAVLFFLFYFVYFAIQMHSFSLFIDRNISVMSAGIMIGIVGLFSLVGKLVLGYLSDRMPVRYVVMGTLVLAIVAISLLLLEGPIWILWLFVVLWGFSGPGLVGLLTILAGSCSGRAMMGRMLGIFYIFMSIGYLLGPSLMGYCFDITGSYNLGILIFNIVLIVALPLAYFSRPPRETALPLT
jgi:sugar phosphate permease